MLELINWLKGGVYRIKTLKILRSSPHLSSELADKLSINRASMSRILKNLKDKSLVETITSKSRTITYKLTKKGSDVLDFTEGKENQW